MPSTLQSALIYILDEKSRSSAASSSSVHGRMKRSGDSCQVKIPPGIYRSVARCREAPGGGGVDAAGAVRGASHWAVCLHSHVLVGDKTER